MTRATLPRFADDRDALRWLTGEQRRDSGQLYRERYSPLELRIIAKRVVQWQRRHGLPEFFIDDVRRDSLRGLVTPPRTVAVLASELLRLRAQLRERVA